MATLAAAAARRAASLSSISTPRTPTQAANLIHKRGLAGAADHHGLPKVNCWQEPLNPSKWKEEHFVIVSLSGWGLLFFGGYKFFTRGKGKKEEDFVRGFSFFRMFMILFLKIAGSTAVKFEYLPILTVAGNNVNAWAFTCFPGLGFVGWQAILVASY